MAIAAPQPRGSDSGTRARTFQWLRRSRLPTTTHIRRVSIFYTLSCFVRLYIPILPPYPWLVPFGGYTRGCWLLSCRQGFRPRSFRGVCLVFLAFLPMLRRLYKSSKKSYIWIDFRPSLRSTSCHISRIASNTTLLHRQLWVFAELPTLDNLGWTHPPTAIYPQICASYNCHKLNHIS